MPSRAIHVILSLLIFGMSMAYAVPDPYAWKSVQIHGGGYVTGFSFSKVQAGVLYARTDVGGAYRWNDTTRIWTSLSDAWGSTASWGVLSMATDPVIPGKVYMATGRGAGAMRISSNFGRTWSTYTTPFRIDGNMAGRGTGERLQVDPRKPSTLYYGAWGEGLYKSLDSGKTWAQVTSFPATKITYVFLDSSTGSASQGVANIFVGTADLMEKGDTTVGQIYWSQDAGLTWQRLAGQPVKVLAKSWFAAAEQYSRPALPQRMVKAGHSFWFTFSDQLAPGSTTGGLYRWNSTTQVWTQVFPVGHTAQGAYCAVTVHPRDTNTILVGSLGRWYPRKDEMHLTHDGGATWTTLNEKIAWGNPYQSHPAGTSWMSDVQIDPFNGNHAIFNSGASTHQTRDLERAFTKDTTHWDLLTKGIEETVIIGLTSTPTGAPLNSAIGDIGGFRHFDLDSAAHLRYNTGSGNTYQIDFAESNPSFMVRSHDGGGASYSLDAGANWQAFPTQPPRVKRASFISVSSNAKSILWAAADSFTYRTSDTGKTWTQVMTVPVNGRPRADRKNPAVFYIVQGSRGLVMKSLDSGKTFADQAAGFPRSGSNVSFVPSFDSTGHLWVSLGANGLHQSRDGGQSWTHITLVTSAMKFSLGKPKANQIHPTLYLAGAIQGAKSIWRSDDRGTSWVSIHDSTQSPESLHHVVAVLEGDRQVYGRVYVGTGGRGIFYGAMIPQNTNHAPTDVSLSNSTLEENARTGTLVGVLSTTDPDVGNTFTYALVAGTGSTHNGNFTISGSELKSKMPLDYEWASQRSIRVRATDQDGLSLEKVLTIQLQDVPDNLPVQILQWNANMRQGVDRRYDLLGKQVQ